MPNPTPPGVIPIWTQGNTAVRTQPTNGEQFAGFVPNFRPPSSWHNWLFGVFSDWIQYLAFAVQGNGPVSNVGHNFLTGTTVQQQLDETDATLSDFGLQVLTSTVFPTDPTKFNITPLPANQSAIIVFLDGVPQVPSDFTFVVVGGVGTLTIPGIATGQTPFLFGLTTNAPGGTGGSSGSGGYVVYGSTGSPVVVDPTAGVTSDSDQRALNFIASNGGVVSVSANPQVSIGSKVGQELRLVGTSDANAIILADGNGLKLNGPITLGNNVSVDLYWNGSVWVESDRSN